jgi:transposase
MVRQSRSKAIFDDLETRLHAQLTKISGKSPLAGAIRYSLTRMKKLRPWLDNGFLELDNSTAERSMRPILSPRAVRIIFSSAPRAAANQPPSPIR